MSATKGVTANAPLRRSSKHQYRLMFCASDAGLAKRVELLAQDASIAIDLALADAAERTVDIWEDGDFLCRISRREEPDRTNAKVDDVR